MDKNIRAINLAAVRAVISRQKLLRPADISVGEELYRAFLFLRKRYPKITVVPHPMADVFWHQHILLTKKYHADCGKLFGHYLHHDPTPPHRLQHAKKKTIELLTRHFLCSGN